MLKTSRILQRYHTGSWTGFWVTPDEHIFQGDESHQEILDSMNSDDSYDAAFDRGWVRGYIQSGEAGFEGRSILKLFHKLQDIIRDYAQDYRIHEVLFDLNGSAYAVPLRDFLSMSKSAELRPYRM